MTTTFQRKLTTNQIIDLGEDEFKKPEDAFNAVEHILRSVSAGCGDKHNKAKTAVESIISRHPAFSLAIYDLYQERITKAPLPNARLVDIPKLTINTFIINNKGLFTQDGWFALRAINLWGHFWKPQEISLSEQDSYREAKKVGAAGTVLRDAEMIERDKHLLFVEDLTDAVTILTKRFNGLSAIIQYNRIEDFESKTIQGDMHESHGLGIKILAPIFQWKLDRQRPA